MKELLIRLCLWVLKKCKADYSIGLNTIVMFRHQRFNVRRIDWTAHSNGIDTLTITAEEIFPDKICYTATGGSVIG